MKSSHATAEVFYTAFKALKADEREAFMEKVVSDSSFREDLIDIQRLSKRQKKLRAKQFPIENILRSAAGMIKILELRRGMLI